MRFVFSLLLFDANVRNKLLPKITIVLLLLGL